MVAKSCSCTTAAGWLKAYVMGHTTFQLVQDFFHPLLSQKKTAAIRSSYVKLLQWSTSDLNDFGNGFLLPPKEWGEPTSIALSISLLH
jgi:hypothetical protein